MITQLIFYLVAAVSVLSGLGVVFSRNVVHAALFLILNLLTVAGLYVLLSSEFLALVQTLIYGGAVTILLLFVLMLTRVTDMPQALDGPQKPLAILAGLALIGLIGYMVYATAWPRAADVPTAISIQQAGEALFRTWLIPFEVASLVLLVALIGAVVIARTEEEE